MQFLEFGNPIYNKQSLFMMLRTAVIQSLRCASRSAVRTQLPARRIAPCLAVPANRSFPAQKFQARCYSAPAGLSKPEVEGRIMDLLKNFDKVGAQRASGAGRRD